MYVYNISSTVHNIMLVYVIIKLDLYACVRIYPTIYVFLYQPIAPTRWNYHHFERQNNLVKDLIDTYYPHILYMDIYKLTMLRADSHADSLHYCHPGPINTWSRILYNIIYLISNYHQLI